ncbi:hypothetical protein [Proteus myxofaciens]|uniref:Uncharacterized protein n=1 Tax=Proteus myxofaciens ATCC 19692 TaxID=1354337 RepID=A0A198FKQ5_9GAMM|nr:hypothetical protein [Proteus myxofaciens]OAT25345.1 hypothetical protein M983_2369 [Proteus myxofaciens ATCC 19692]
MTISKLNTSYLNKIGANFEKGTERVFNSLRNAIEKIKNTMCKFRDHLTNINNKSDISESESLSDFLNKHHAMIAKFDEQKESSGFKDNFEKDTELLLNKKIIDNTLNDSEA